MFIPLKHFLHLRGDKENKAIQTHKATEDNQKFYTYILSPSCAPAHHPSFSQRVDGLTAGILIPFRLNSIANSYNKIISS